MQLPPCALQVSNDTRQNHLYSHLNNDHRSSLRSHTGTSSKDEPACAGKQLNVFEDLLESRSPTWKCHHIKSDMICFMNRQVRQVINKSWSHFLYRKGIWLGKARPRLTRLPLGRGRPLRVLRTHRRESGLEQWNEDIFVDLGVQIFIAWVER